MITEIAVTRKSDEFHVSCVFDRTAEQATPTSMVVIIPVDAIAHRKEFYSCTTDEEAIRAILAEHYARMNRLDQRPPKDLITRKVREWEELTPKERRQATKIDQVRQIVGQIVLPPETPEGSEEAKP